MNRHCRGAQTVCQSMKRIGCLYVIVLSGSSGQASGVVQGAWASGSNISTSLELLLPVDEDVHLPKCQRSKIQIGKV
jgi:hypothetical protein